MGVPTIDLINQNILIEATMSLMIVIFFLQSQRDIISKSVIKTNNNRLLFETNESHFSGWSRAGLYNGLAVIMTVVVLFILSVSKVFPESEVASAALETLWLTTLIASSLAIMIAPHLSKKNYTYIP